MGKIKIKFKIIFLLIIFFSFFGLAKSSQAADASPIVKKDVYRVSNPCYSIAQYQYGVNNAFNLDSTKVIFRETTEDSSDGTSIINSKPECSDAGRGRGWVWGEVSELKNAQGNLADYKNKAQPIWPVHYHDGSMWKITSVHWSRIPGEENILYAAFKDGWLKRIDVTTIDGTVTEAGDAHNQMSNWQISGADNTNTNNGKLYWRLYRNGTKYAVTLYKDAGGTQSVAYSYEVDWPVGGNFKLLSYNNSGLQATVAVNYISDDATIAQNIISEFPVWTKWVQVTSSVIPWICGEAEHSNPKNILCTINGTGDSYEWPGTVQRIDIIDKTITTVPQSGWLHFCPAPVDGGIIFSHVTGSTITTSHGHTGVDPTGSYGFRYGSWSCNSQGDSSCKFNGSNPPGVVRLSDCKWFLDPDWDPPYAGHADWWNDQDWFFGDGLGAGVGNSPGFADYAVQIFNFDRANARWGTPPRFNIYTWESARAWKITANDYANFGAGMGGCDWNNCSKIGITSHGGMALGETPHYSYTDYQYNQANQPWDYIGFYVVETNLAHAGGTTPPAAPQGLGVQ